MTSVTENVMEGPKTLKVNDDRSWMTFLTWNKIIGYKVRRRVWRYQRGNQNPL